MTSSLKYDDSITNTKISCILFDPCQTYKNRQVWWFGETLQQIIGVGKCSYRPANVHARVSKKLPKICVVLGLHSMILNWQKSLILLFPKISYPPFTSKNSQPLFSTYSTFSTFLTVFSF